MDPLAPGPDETLDALAGDWRVLQLRRGHRFSTDDLVVAWRAAANAPEGATRLLDLGCGIGSVGLTTLHLVDDPEATLHGVEVQEVSARLVERSVRLNDLADRVSIHHGDLRDPGVLPEGARFDLLTGSPPYIPEGHGLLSPVPQRAGARIELRGSIYDYCEAARRWMAPGARFAFVMAAADERTEDAPRAHDLEVLERMDVVFRAGRDPHIAVLTCARREDGPHPPRRAIRFTVRGEDGEWTAAYRSFRDRLIGPREAVD